MTADERLAHAIKHNTDEDKNGYIRPVNPDRFLEGGPSKTLVKKVRRQLKGYGIMPNSMMQKTWRITWEWAAMISRSYQWKSKTYWPSPVEIATQYVMLVLMEMREHLALRLPYRAMEQIPESLRLLLAKHGAATVPAIEDKVEAIEDARPGEPGP